MPVKHRRYQPQEVIELTRAAIHAFTSRDMAGFDGLLDPDFSFVGDDAPLFLHGTEEFFNSTQNERKSPPVSITAVSYTHLDVYKRQPYSGAAACFPSRLSHRFPPPTSWG